MRDGRHVLSVVVLGVFAILASGTTGGGGTTTGPSKNTPKDHGSMAFIQCKDFVTQRLKAPSTADFPFLDFQAAPLGNETYLVKSYVDAQNSFGAKIRTTWYCKVRYKGGEDADRSNWELLDLSLAE